MLHKCGESRRGRASARAAAPCCHVRDVVEDGELVVPLIGTAINSADFFTKPMPLDKFLSFRKIIMNLDD